MKDNETNVVKIYTSEWYTTWYKCISCGDNCIAESFNYCPSCGRKIVERLV